MTQSDTAPPAPEEEPASADHLALAQEAEATLKKLQAEGGANINVLIPLIKATIGAVGKNRRMEEGPAKYLYRSVDDMLDAAHAGLVRAGVFPVPVAYSHVREGKNGEPVEWPGLRYVDFLTKNKVQGVRITGQITYRLTGPKDTLDVPILVEGNDYSDKVTAKGYSLGIKLLMSQLFLIPYGLPDQDEDAPQREAPESGQRQGGGQRSQGQRPSAPRTDGGLASENNVKAILNMAAELSGEGRAKLKAERQAAGAGGPIETGKLTKEAWRTIMTLGAKLVKEYPKSHDGEVPAEPETPSTPAPEPEATEPPAPEGVDHEYREHLADRLGAVDQAGEGWGAEVQAELDGLEGNPLAEEPWETQVAELPPEWDEPLQAVTAKLEKALADQAEPLPDEEPF